MPYQAKLEDSNVAKIGSDEDLEARVAAAKTEEEWKGAGKKEGLEIWRVEKFNIKKWPKNEYGRFYNGDSYIVLKTYKKDDDGALRWDVHFWLGEHSTQDEKGVAAYKTVELDDLLGTLPVQHREVQNYESDLFSSYFKEIQILEGGIESGFNHVKPEEYKPRLLHIFGKRRVKVKQVPVSCKSLNRGDAFILDAGQKIFLWLPKESGVTEKFRAAQLSVNIRSDRKGNQEEIRLGEEGSDEFWKYLTADGSSQDDIKGKEEEWDALAEQASKTNVMYKLSDETGKLVFTKIAEGNLPKSGLDTNDAFIIDVGDNVICWIGKKASKNEKKKAVLYAERYLGLNNRPAWIPITRVTEGDETKYFWKNFTA